MRDLLILGLITSATVWAVGVPNTCSNNHRPHSVLKKFTNLVAFGDSYTDENRLRYFIDHQGNPPPTGTLLPASNSTPGGGITWDRWVSNYTGAKLYNYAVSGAVCSDKMIYRYYARINGPFPGVIEYEVPAFIADTNYINASTGTNTLFTDRKSDNTVYSMWIGTNDLGAGAILTDQQAPGTNITTFTECVFQAFDQVYAAGGRYFVLMNTAPLHLSPLYSTLAAGGVQTSVYWPNKPSNLTATSEKMKEYTTSVNTIWAYQTPFSLLVSRRYPDAAITLFDVHRLLTDIYTNPTAYLQAPANVTGYVHHCGVNGTGCYDVGDIDAFMWFDELHPSQGTDRVIAREFVAAVQGNSSYATYWEGDRRKR